MLILLLVISDLSDAYIQLGHFSVTQKMIYEDNSHRYRDVAILVKMTNIGQCKK